jgi:hypothetical protein
VNIGSQPSRIWPPVRLEGAKQVITMFVAEAYNVEIAITNDLSDRDRGGSELQRLRQGPQGRTQPNDISARRPIKAATDHAKVDRRFSKPALFVASAVLRPHAPSHGRTSCINAMPGTQRRGPRPRRP